MIKREFLRTGKAIEEEPLHYTACGLDDIYLRNGFERRTTPYGEGVVISDIDGLHKAIGLFLICDRKTLSPKELRFLRNEMGLTQETLGQRLRLSGQQVARWEKGQCEISGPAETLLRILYVVELLPKQKRSAFINELMAKLDELSRKDETSPKRLTFRETEKGWMSTKRADCDLAMA